MSTPASSHPESAPPLPTWRNELPYPFCPGCGHHLILEALDRALVRLHLDPARVVLVSDIGCSGLSDQYFDTSAFHGLHGRSITYASGIKLARPDLHVVVIMGDGGTGIGGAHLLAAARRNIGLTLLVFNNLNFGMTGGQHSTTTPVGAMTPTTPGGNLERPLDLCATVAVNGAGHVYRGTTWERDLADRIAAGIAHPGFALLDIWELCTAYYAPANRMTGKGLRALMAELGFTTGVLATNDRPEFATAWRQALAGELGKPPGPTLPRPLSPLFSSSLTAPFRLVVAGSAGGRVRSTSRLAAEAAILSGLYAAQRDDYPITVKTGHSIAELVFSPEEIAHTGASRPDALLILTEDGAKKARPYLARMGESSHLFAPPAFLDLPTRARKSALALPGTLRGPSTLAALAAVLRQLGLFPIPALEAAVRRDGRYVAENLRAIEASAPPAAEGGEPSGNEPEMDEPGN